MSNSVQIWRHGVQKSFRLKQRVQGMRLRHTLHKICVFRSKTLCLPLCVTFKGKTWHTFSSEKLYSIWTKNKSNLVGKIGITFRHLIAKWESSTKWGSVPNLIKAELNHGNACIKSRQSIDLYNIGVQYWWKYFEHK